MIYNYSMENLCKIAVVEDDELLNSAIVKILKKEGLNANGYLNSESLYDFIKEKPDFFNLILCDYMLPGMNGLELFKNLKKDGISIPFVIITGLKDISLAIESIKIGVLDFLVKPVEKELLISKIKMYLDLDTQYNLEIYNSLKEKVIFKSPVMKEILKKISRVANAKISILIEGESGVGKEVLARALHSISERKNYNFVPINCSAIPDTLFESELYGYKKGSFTSAHKDYEGIARSANGGTLFLDEISEISLNSQAKLLRFLETKQVQPIGEAKIYDVDLRIISATNSDLLEKVKNKFFREDLYYRIAGIKIKIPPLRERKEDIIPIAEFILMEISKEENIEGVYLTPSAKEKILSYPWYGNIRELKNKIYEALLSSDKGKIEAKDITLEEKRDEQVSKAMYAEAKKNFEKEYIEKLLIQTKGNIKEISKISGLSRKAIYEILKKHNIDPSNYRS